MGLVVRQSIFITIVSYVGILIGYLNVLYLFPKFLDPAEVGLLRTIQDAAILFSPFAQFGLAHTMLRFYPQLVKEKANQGGFVTLILMMALGGFVIFLVVFKVFEGSILHYFDENAGAVLRYVPVILWLTFILLISGILEAYSRSLLKTVFPNLMKEVATRALLAMLVTAYFLGWLSFESFIIGTVIAYLVILISMMVYLASSKNLSFSSRFSFITKEKRKELIVYSLLSFAGSAAMIILGKIDSLMIAGLMGLKYVAVYTTGFYMASVIEIPKKALSSVAMPLISQAFEKDDIKHIHTIYQKTSLNQLIAGALLLIGVVINLDNIYDLMPRKEIYEAGRWVVILVGAGKLADMAFGPSSEIVVLSKYFWFNIILIILLAGTSIIANNILIPRYGIDGAAMSVAFAVIMFNAVKYVFILATLKIQPFNAATFIVLAIAAATVGLNYIIPDFDNIFVDLILRSGIVTVFYGAAILLTKVSPEVNQLFNKGLKLIGI
ncbi:MAG TPA: oligosaccharide flippase family protein [Cyclobacteriaceae bacterium]|nr:oligosaccharide flippase family protein [Cyclobacteriaceae bacterium]